LKAESRKQKAESRKQKAESRKYHVIARTLTYRAFVIARHEAIQHTGSNPEKKNAGLLRTSQ
jgi:hypothetical protein